MTFVEREVLRDLLEDDVRRLSSKASGECFRNHFDLTPFCKKMLICEFSRVHEIDSRHFTETVKSSDFIQLLYPGTNDIIFMIVLCKCGCSY
jgi:hypothetical protein